MKAYYLIVYTFIYNRNIIMLALNDNNAHQL